MMGAPVMIGKSYDYDVFCPIGILFAWIIHVSNDEKSMDKTKTNELIILTKTYR